MKHKGFQQAVHFANAAEGATGIVAFLNDVTVGHDGWAQLAPYGDYPGTALVRQSDGTIQKFPAIQRLDRAAAEEMVSRFKSVWHRLKRYFTGCHIYVGHPDVPAFANDYPDKTPKGMIVDLQVRAEGLFCKPIFTDEGSDLVETKKLRAFSAYWSAREAGEQSGPDGKTWKIYRPDVLKSAGLTNHPKLPVHLLNEAPSNLQTAKHAQSNPIMNKKLVLDFLATQGITLANEATDDQVAAALHKLGDRVTAAETTLASRAVELESLSTELANERKFHRDTLLDSALADGRITAAQRPDWATRLEANFANESAALAQLAPMLKTKALTLNFGARKAEIANATDRRDALDTLVKAEMAVNGGDYDRAFATVQRANPALFSAMKQPQHD